MTTRSREQTAAMVQQSASTGRLAASHGATPRVGSTAGLLFAGWASLLMLSLHVILRECGRTTDRADAERKVGDNTEIAPTPEATARSSTKLV